MKKIFVLVVVMATVAVFVPMAQAQEFEMWREDALFVELYDGSRFLITFSSGKKTRIIDTNDLQEYGVADAHVLQNHPRDLDKAATAYHVHVGNLNGNDAVRVAIERRDREIRADGRARDRYIARRNQEWRQVINDFRKIGNREGWWNWRRW